MNLWPKRIIKLTFFLQILVNNKTSKYILHINWWSTIYYLPILLFTLKSLNIPPINPSFFGCFRSCNPTRFNSTLMSQIPQMHLAGWYWSCRLQHQAAYCYCPEHLHFHLLHLIGLLLKIGFLMDRLWVFRPGSKCTSLKIGGYRPYKNTLLQCIDFPPQKFQAIQAYYHLQVCSERMVKKISYIQFILFLAGGFNPSAKSWSSNWIFSLSRFEKKL